MKKYKYYAFSFAHATQKTCETNNNPDDSVLFMQFYLFPVFISLFLLISLWAAGAIYPTGISDGSSRLYKLHSTVYCVSLTLLSNRGPED